MDKLLERFETLFTEFKVGRLIFWIVLAVVLLVTGAVIETTTGIRFLWSMDRKVALLKELNGLAKDGIAQRPELLPIYNETVWQLDSYNVEPVTFSGLFDAEGLIKFIAGIAPWVLLVLVYLAQKNKPASWLAGVVVASIFGLLLGTIGSLLPNMGSVWVNVLVYIVVSILIFSAVARRAGGSRVTGSQ